MKRYAAALAILGAGAVAIFLATDTVRQMSPPPAPGDASAEGRAQPVPPPIGLRNSETDERDGVAEAEKNGRAGGKPPIPTELVLIDGSTGTTVRTERVEFTRRIETAADHTPSPFVPDEDGFVFSGPLSIFAERVELMAVVWPELDLTVRVEKADGTPARRTDRLCLYYGGRGRSVEAVPVGASGLFRIRGLPWMREERVWADINIPEGLTRTGRLPTDPARSLIRLDPADDPVITDTLVSDHNETDNDMPFEETLPLGRNDGKALFEVRVRALRSDGSPAAGVMVTWQRQRSNGSFGLTNNEGRTDADGVRVLMFVTPDPVWVAVREPGFLFGKAVAATPVRKDPPEILLREDAGADLDVFVVDGENRPLPGARIEVDLPGWVWLENGVQRLGFFTGPDGRVRLPRLPLEEVRIHASYGSRRMDRIDARPPGRVELMLPRRE